MNIKPITALLFTLVSFVASAQNKQYADSCLSIITSEKFHGRGFTNNGDKITAKFIVNRLKKTKAKPLNSQNGYYQYFNIDINTFPYKEEVKFLPDKKLITGKDYLINPISSTLKAKLKCVEIDTNNRMDYTGKCIILDKKKLYTFGPNEFAYLKYYNPLKAAAYIEISDNKLMQEQSSEAKNWVWIELKRESYDSTAKEVFINIKNKFIENYKTQNIVAEIKGKSDSVIMFIAHYDHLGEFGEALFPGMNDNGSGIVTLLDLANYFSQHKPDYTTVFLFAGAEEVGLLGSKYFFENPLFDLKKSKLIINLDVIGSGEKGIAIVNGKNLSSVTNKIKNINKEHSYFKHIKVRDNVPNGDHYFFAAAGLPAVFIYTEGNYLEYHSIYDKQKDLIFPKYNEFFKLIVELVSK